MALGYTDAAQSLRNKPVFNQQSPENPRSSRLLRWVLIAAGAVVVIVVLAYLATPPLTDLRNEGSEASATASIRAVLSAQTVFAIDCGFFYAPSLTTLGAAPGQPLSQHLATSDQVEQSGYRLWIDAQSDPDAPACQGLPAGTAAKTFIVRAEPIVPDGGRFFAANADGELFQGARPIQFANGKPSGDVERVP